MASSSRTGQFLQESWFMQNSRMTASTSSVIRKFSFLISSVIIISKILPKVKKAGSSPASFLLMILLYHRHKGLSTIKLHKDFGIDCATCLYQNFTSKFVQLAQTQNSARRGRQCAGENVFMKNAQKYRVDFSTLYLPDFFPEFGNLVIID